MRLIMGIDPGWSGGLAVIDTDNGTIVAKSFTNCTEKDIVDCIDSFKKDCINCYIEKVHAMPGQGVTSMFKFGHIYGLLRGTLMALNIPLIEISPMKWQTYLNCLTKGNKNITKAKAQQLYPQLKVTHATADAILIATYGLHQYRIFNGEVLS